ncbi:MAG TPA: hypothetical protein VHX12_14260 [Acidisoma sp.]|nr:hypothetical protein [Acidisoma sp.]
MKKPTRPIPLYGLWRISAAIVVVLCAVASRLALGAAVPTPVAGDANALSRLEAAMVVCGPTGTHKPPTPQPAPRGFSFDDQVLLDLAEAAVALPPAGVGLPPAPLLVTEAVQSGFSPATTLARRRGYRPAARAPPAPI